MKEKQLDSLLENINYEISILANTSAFIKQEFEDVSWAGFYLNQNQQLILGPFQGLIACTLIPFDKGVCGACASSKKTICVENVHEFPGHIACDSASNSEIVIPIIIDDDLYGVLDLDSTSFNRFKKDDQIILEKLVAILVKHLKRIKCYKVNCALSIIYLLTFFIKFMFTFWTCNCNFTTSSWYSYHLFTAWT